MMPVRFSFRGEYGNSDRIWQQTSSWAIMLTNSETKWYEKAFITIILVNLGYSAKSLSKPDKKIKWEHFLDLIDAHCAGTTGSKRKISDNFSYLAPLHLDSIMRMVQCDGKSYEFVFV
jgi:hypothetical protein